ncbi:hypothetical protein AJ78_08372 [Emergomyces pasteurianus Ep9510]|uniref:GmrSD restriction endonucleases C-terminal domain-containing protein n=1 Tax=Emergomyces pasteurianus Ep9510 TaxID=1447872 RepID=A0A1J9P499_9EURO|nr:hypothetical protein AJ78_08372 [Emergomyces pasteurianus Ep9510]
MVYLTSSLPVLLAALTTLTTSSIIPLNTRTPPNIPSPAEARSLLSAITVAPQGLQDGYSRDLFPHWITIQGACSTRETVLKRDGTNVNVGNDCYPSSGSWYSAYDGAIWTKASDLDIDHMVPLSNAWKSGAAAWTTEKRKEFANDLVNPQLLAVTDNVNQEKSDSGPEAWKPPLQTYHCEYARMWVKVKSFYELTITDPEKSALADMLDTC